jgi:tetratricopeptide (TPR) repeat protein
MSEQRLSGVGKVLLVLALLLVLNAAYLAAYGGPTLFYVLNSLLHPLLGIAAGILFVALVARHRAAFGGLLGTAVWLLLGLSAGFGVFLMIGGMTRPHSLELYLHVGFAIAGLFFLLVHLRSRLVAGRGSRQETSQPAGLPYRQLWRLGAGVAVASLVFYGTVTLYEHFYPNPQYVIHNPSTPPLTMDQEGGGAGSLIFPSSAVTADGKTIPAEFFMNSVTCKKCHADIYRQWYSSMHHFASFNNQWYRKAIEYMQDTVGIKPSLWCGGCHDHALVFTDMMQKYPIRQIEHTPEAQIGLGCMSCHGIVAVKSTMGQGNYVMQYPWLDRYASSKNPVMRWLHDYVVKLNPKPHRAVFLKPFHKNPVETPEFCSLCHKVHLDVPVNHYRWIRGFDDYDNWQASGVSGLGARSFYYPPKPLECADCHMPLVPSKDFGNIHGFVHSHRFVAANTAVPTSHGDKQQVADVEKFLKGAVTVDVFGLAEEPSAAEQAVGLAGPAAQEPQLASTFAVGEESAQGLTSAGVSRLPVAKLMAPLGRVKAYLRRGEVARVEVVVRTRKVGHFFPGGTVDAFDCWVELQARDKKGHILYWSGEVADNGRGPVDPGAHFYRSLQLDGHGNPINKRNAWATRATVYARLIPPGAADTVHFRLKVPEDCGDSITLTAKLNYRKFDWWITQWAFAGIRDPLQPAHAVTPDYDDTQWVFKGNLSDVSAKYKKIPNVPIVVMSENDVTVPVLPRSSAPFQQVLDLNPKDRERWNDYGIGLLLQGDLKGAERAFGIVTKLDPQYADGWVNVARARVQEGNIEAAKPLLEKALQLNPRLGAAHYFMGLALKTEGKYPEAYAEFAKAADRYPQDRVVRDQMGRLLFLQRKYRAAVAEFAKTLAVDPEDLEAHYNLMLCYRGLNEDALANREEKLYLRFKANEISRAITGPYKLTHPDDNNEAQPIHEHVSAPIPLTTEEVLRVMYAKRPMQHPKSTEKYAVRRRGRQRPRPLATSARSRLQAQTSSGGAAR